MDRELVFGNVFAPDGTYLITGGLGALGMEAAGVVEAVGEGVDLAVGDRVAYCSAGFGAYSEAINLPASRLVGIPEGIDFEQAASA